MSAYVGDETPLLSLPEAGRKVTHQLFRYPAKFHPPVLKALLERYTTAGSVVLDPFAGSGTAMVESAISGRPSVGVDIDPVAIRIALAKTRMYELEDLRKYASILLESLSYHERPSAEYQRLMHSDITEAGLQRVVTQENLWVPEIPRLQHWFRRYVIVDLARIKQFISELSASADSQLFFDAVFASIIRNSSNADPVPVSGLEYTSHMKARDSKGRLVNPYALLRSALRKALAAVEEYCELLTDASCVPRLIQGSATNLGALTLGPVDAVITSPPYHNAVDYYRRHQLEMFWLGLTNSQAERLELLPGYIGRPRVAAKDPLLQLPWNAGPLAQHWEREMRKGSLQRASDFRHYVTAMTLCWNGLAQVVPSGSPVVFVVGNSTWNGNEIPTRELFTEICGNDFSIEEQLYYPIMNRYMSYTRRNLASIDKEYVIAFRRL